MTMTLRYPALFGTGPIESFNMLVMILESVPRSLRGELSRWMIQPRTGVYVGKVSSLVRDRLWEKCLDSVKEGSVIQIWSADNEQGFEIRAHGLSGKEVIDMEGITLISETTK